MIKRILTAIVFAPFILLIIFKSEIGFFLLVSAIGIICISEIYTMLGLSPEKKFSENKLKIFCYAGYVSYISILFCFRNQVQGLNGTDALSLLFLVVAVLALLKQQFSDIFHLYGKIVIPVVYVSLLGYLVAIYRFHHGNRLVTFVILSLWASDTCAYFYGIKFGKRRLYEEVSPKKSVEGAYAGFWAPVVIFTLLALSTGSFSFLFSVCAGAVIGLVGQIGDLAESALKRQFQVKDSSNLLPGHGGMLDRFDSLLFVAPVMYWLIKMFPGVF